RQQCQQCQQQAGQGKRPQSMADAAQQPAQRLVTVQHFDQGAWGQRGIGSSGQLARQPQPGFAQPGTAVAAFEQKAEQPENECDGIQPQQCHQGQQQVHRTAAVAQCTQRHAGTAQYRQQAQGQQCDA